MITYKNIKGIDAQLFWEMLNKLDEETPYMMFEKGEREKKQDLESIVKVINQIMINKDLLYVAQDDEKIIGYISAKRGSFRKISHSAYVVIGIRKDYRGHGLGNTFFDYLDKWALKEGLKRLELTVICENLIAKKLYEKHGFQVEGIKEKSIFMNDKFYDEYYMAKLI